MFEAMLAGPLREPAHQVDGASSNFPTLVSDFHDGPNRSCAEDAPSALADVRNPDDLPVHQRRYRAGPDRRSNVVNVATERRFQVVHILGRPEHLEIEPRTALPVQVNRVPLVEVNPPGGLFGFPPRAFVSGG